jgi:hypothetical protein
MLQRTDSILRSACSRCTGLTRTLARLPTEDSGEVTLIQFLARRPAGRVALKACGSAHWWVRKIRSLGHEIVLLHAQFIRRFVQTRPMSRTYVRTGQQCSSLECARWRPRRRISKPRSVCIACDRCSSSSGRRRSINSGYCCMNSACRFARVGSRARPKSASV